MSSANEVDRVLVYEILRVIMMHERNENIGPLGLCKPAFPKFEGYWSLSRLCEDIALLLSLRYFVFEFLDHSAGNISRVGRDEVNRNTNGEAVA